MTYDDLEGRVITKAAAVTRTDAKRIDPMLIAIIIEVIFKIISSCMFKQSPRQIKTTANRPILSRVVILQNLRDTGLNRTDINSAATIIADLGKDATEADITSIATLSGTMVAGTDDVDASVEPV